MYIKTTGQELFKRYDLQMGFPAIINEIQSTMTSIVLVEDDPVLKSNFMDLLTYEGFDVEGFSDRVSALERLEGGLPDIILLDISLGNESEAGFEICRAIRKQSETVPVVFITSHASDFDKISGLRLGADDYLTKDISMDYLIVRIKALLKRVQVLTNSAGNKNNTVLDRGDLQINLDELTIYWKSQRVSVSLTQFWMVHALAKHPGHVQSHGQLMQASSITVEPNTIAAHIKNIREHFQEIDPTFSAIKAERGVGYRWINPET